MPNQVILKGDPITKEGKAAEAVSPSELIEFSSGELQAHSTAGGNAQPRFAVENDLFGEGLDTDYETGDEVTYIVGRQGDEVYALLSGLENVNEDDALESDGAGALQAFDTASSTNDNDDVVAYAAEDLDNSGSSARTRIKVEVA